MVKTKIVSTRDMEILKKYLSDESIVLIDESVLDQLSEKESAYIRKNDERDANYIFEGDCVVELVTDSDHRFIDFLFPDSNN